MTRYRSVIALGALALAATQSFALGTEQYRKKHAPEQWGYHRWVNGYDLYCYDGNIDALNNFLEWNCTPSHWVILRPGPHTEFTFDNEPLLVTWTLENSEDSMEADAAGYAEFIGSNPKITIYIDDAVAVDKLIVPPDAQLFGPAAMKARYRGALDHPNDEIRVAAIYRLAKISPYDADTVSLISRRLSDEKEYVRVSAWRALSQFGECAKAALPAMRRLEQTESERRMESLRFAIETIENSHDMRKDVRQYRSRAKTIDAFVETFRKARRGNTEQPVEKTYERVETD